METSALTTDVEWCTQSAGAPCMGVRTAASSARGTYLALYRLGLAARTHRALGLSLAQGQSRCRSFLVDGSGLSTCRSASATGALPVGEAAAETP